MTPDTLAAKALVYGCVGALGLFFTSTFVAGVVLGGCAAVLLGLSLFASEAGKGE